MRRHCFVREWRRLCHGACQLWSPGGDDQDLARLRRRSELVERGGRHGADVLREIKSHLPAVEATLVPTIEDTLWTFVDGSEDWDVIEEWVGGIVMAELRGGARGWTPQDAAF
jgi:hypothetical protein